VEQFVKRRADNPGMARGIITAPRVTRAASALDTPSPSCL
jgi:hypothetical protein